MFRKGVFMKVKYARPTIPSFDSGIVKTKIKKQGSNQHRDKYKYPLGLKKDTFLSVIWLFVLLLIIGVFLWYYKRSQILVRPIPESYQPSIIKFVKVAVASENIDTYIDRYSRKYARNDDQYSYLKQLMHCLLHFESKHGIVKRDGDNGLAGGIAQFHQDTWVRMRKQMLKLGLIKEIGSRYDEEMAIQTTIWAVVNGRGKEWGPILRGSCQ